VTLIAADAADHFCRADSPSSRRVAQFEKANLNSDLLTLANFHN
jgi:hypothetical protein